MLAPVSKLLPLTGRILASTPSHRVSEYTAATDPNDPDHVAVALIDWDDESGAGACRVHASFDAGRTWIRGEAIKGLDQPTARVDPWVAIGQRGEAHLTCMDFVRERNNPFRNEAPPYVELKHARSDDGGLTWTEAKRVPPRAPNNSVDKDAVYVTRNGTLLVCVNEYPRAGGPDDDIIIYRSTDGGSTWGPISVVGTRPKFNGFGGCNGIVEDSQGRLFLPTIVTLDQGGGLFVVLTSDDAGATWAESFRQPWPSSPTFPDPDDNTTLIANLELALPTISINPLTGAVVVSVHDWDSRQNEWFIHLWRTTDRGAHWTKATLPTLPSTVCPDCVHMGRGALAHDASGHLGLEFWRFSPQHVFSEVWFAASSNDGSTWSEPFLVSSTGPAHSAANPKTWLPQPANVVGGASYAARGPAEAYDWIQARRLEYDGLMVRHGLYGGDYSAIAATKDGFLALWIDRQGDGGPQLWAQVLAPQ